MTINVDSETCTGCGTCAKICPMEVIGMDDDIPVIQEGREALCISCGQCEAFCPSGALREGTDKHRTVKAPGKDLVSSDVLGLYLKSRRSIRKYRPERVSKETIKKLLDISRYAATGGNAQPVEWMVVYDPDAVHKVAAHTIDYMKELVKTNHPMSSYVPHLIARWDAGNDVICRGAPHLLIPHVPEESPMAPNDAIIALTHFDIAAPAFGVGTCWAGLAAMALRSHKPLQDLIHLPQGRVPAYAMMFGYPEYVPSYIPGRKPLNIIWK